MSAEALLELRDKLANNSALTDFFATHYGKAVTFLVGYKSPNAANYPQVCIVPVTNKVGGGFGDEVRVSIVIGVNDPEFENGVSNGVLHSQQAAELVITCLETDRVGPNTTYTGEATVISDKSLQHPFYEIEIVIRLLWRNR